MATVAKSICAQVQMWKNIEELAQEEHKSVSKLTRELLAIGLNQRYDEMREKNTKVLEDLKDAERDE